MIANHIPLMQFMDGVHQYVIPIFQRDYSWGIKHCKQLWDDVIRAGGNQHAKAHFLGSVVYIGAEDITADVPRWLVIDGQQRLTTMTLLFTALRDHLKKVGDGDELPTTSAAIEDRFLRNQHAKQDRCVKLALRRGDHETLMALAQGKEPPASASERVRDNHAYFLEQLADADLATVWRGLAKLVIVHVSLTRGQDDPQLIFESLNSTGLDLTQADLIRNYVLMRLGEEEQSRLYAEYWQPIEVAFGARYRSEFDKLARDWLTLHLRPSKQLRADTIYQHFREFFLRASGARSVEDILSELHRFGRYYVAYSHGQELNPRLKQAFAGLRQLVDVATPLMLRLYDCFERAKTLSEAELVEATGLLESYVFRRSVCDMQSRSLGQIFANLAYRIEEAQPLASLKVALARHGKSNRFPNDTEFREALATRDVYVMRNCRYLLDRLENESKEKIATDSFSIEHVLPQNDDLRPEWRAMLGTGWKDTQEVWVHRLGNVTLSGYNSEYGDRPFAEKKAMKGGFTDSPLRLNRFIKEQDAWTAKEIDQRGRQLAIEASTIWKPLVVDRSLVQEAELSELRSRAAAFNADTLEMTAEARALFDALQPQLMALGTDVVELFGSKTVTYRVYDFFLEVIPRVNRLVLLLNVDLEDCQPLPDHAWDMAESEFVISATCTEDAGVGYHLRRLKDVPVAMKLARLAYEKVSA